MKCESPLIHYIALRERSLSHFHRIGSGFFSRMEEEARWNPLPPSIESGVGSVRYADGRRRDPDQRREIAPRKKKEGRREGINVASNYDHHTIYGGHF